MEFWDIYDEKLRKTGKTFYEGLKLSDGEYNFLVHIIIKNKENKYLLQQRALTKKYYPGQWDATCGRVQAGEDGITAAIREVNEELGLITQKEQYSLVFHGIYANKIILDIFYLEYDFQLSDCIIQKSEVEQIAFYTKEEMINILSPSKNKKYIDVIEKL